VLTQVKRFNLIRFVDNADKVLLERKLISLPLNEAVVINKSIEFFNDPEPCMIHRSAVMKRLFVEIESYLEAMLQKNIVEIDLFCLPEYLRNYLSLPAGVIKVILV
jgi:hypothetical protein